MGNATRIGTVGCLLALLLFLPAGPSGADEPAEADWADLVRAHHELFRPLPLPRMFTDPERELSLSRRAPYTGAARDELEKARAAVRVERARILNERRKREDLVARIGAAGGERAGALLVRVYEEQQAEIDAARENLAVFDEAARVDINPGVDPGGVYWERWLGKERSAARGVVAAEERVRELALEQCLVLRTPEVTEWLHRTAADGERPEIREQLIPALAATGEPEDAAALGKILGDEREAWARVLILLELAAHPSAAAAPAVLAALADEAWPVRSAAVAAVRALGRRDAAAIDALLGAMEAGEGRVRREARDALCEATGAGFGLEPGEWRLWWGTHREGWEAPAAPAEVPPLEIELPRVFGVPTASTRIAILLNRGSAMRTPVRRRATGNDGEPAPGPEVDTAFRISLWELSEALSSLRDEQEFAVFLYGMDVRPVTRGLVRPTKESGRRAVRAAARFEPEGGSSVHTALAEVLRAGVPKKLEDLALAGEGEIDTVFLVGGSFPRKNRWLARIVRLRRVRVHSVDPASLAGE